MTSNISRLQVKNFQAHTEMAVDLDPAVTVFVGPSDVGKSAIGFRALQWVCLNRPLGDAFLKLGADTVEVSVVLDGRTLTRRRGKDNVYVLDGQEYKSFGDNPPEAVAQLCNLDEINFQGQHESAFWFSLTAGEVARRLNKIVDLGIIDQSNTYLSGVVRGAHATVAAAELAVVDAKYKLDGLAYVPDLVADYDALEKLGMQAGTTSLMAIQLGGVNTQIRWTTNERDEAKAKAQDAMSAYGLGSVAVKRRDKADISAILMADVQRTQTYLDRHAVRREDYLRLLSNCGNAIKLIEHLSGIRTLLARAAKAKAAVDNRPPDFALVTTSLIAHSTALSRKTAISGLLHNARRAKAAADNRPPSWMPLADAITTAQDTASRAGRLKGLLGETKRAKTAVDKRPPDFSPTVDALRVATDTAAKARTLWDLVFLIRRRAADKALWVSRVGIAKDELIDKTEGVCPVCQQPLKS